MGLLGLASLAQAEGLPSEPRVKLDLSVEQAKLIVGTLGVLGCGNVQQLQVCQQAIDLLKDIRRQAGEQLK